MKRLFFLVGLAGLLGIGQAQAQVQFGLKAGVSRTTYVGSNAESFQYKPLVGWHAGLLATIPLMKDGFIALQPELLYAQRGASVEEQGRRFNSRLHYLDIPLLVRLNAGGILLEAGPQVGIFLSQQGNFQANAQQVTYQPIELEYVAGIGYQLPNQLRLGLRYNGGLSKLFSMTQGSTTYPRNSGFQLSAGYSFGQ